MVIDELSQRRIETALFDCDGSCRDINFSEIISSSAALDVLKTLEASWILATAVTATGEDVGERDLARELQQPSGALSTVWNTGCNPEQIQAFVWWDAADRVFCELTFFPQDFDRATFSMAGFLALLDKLELAANSDEFYLRYEDASWRHGGQAQGSVIYASAPRTHQPSVC